MSHQRRQYLVTWCGYGLEDTQWINARELDDNKVLNVWEARAQGSSLRRKLRSAKAANTLPTHAANAAPVAPTRLPILLIYRRFPVPR
ncbi:hypothetical protein OF83DRAFT_1177842 [Amylostereum chailletii]|nr:hypothetical protein OF83DRAFT_1177842 [Amylostereum chailletii]